MSTVLVEYSLDQSDYQRISLEVRCPAYLIENSEELQAIFRNGAKPVSYFIQILETKEQWGFEGRFFSHQVTKTQKFVAEEDTLKVQEEESLIAEPNFDFSGAEGIGTSANTTTMGASDNSTVRLK